MPTILVDETIDQNEDPLAALMSTVLYLSKEAAAHRQIEAAIECWHAGKFDLAITLAGAADGMKALSDSNLFQKILKSRPAAMKPEAAVRNINAARDWLKHTTVSQRECRGFTFFESGFSIIFAADKWEVDTGEIRTFAEVWWFCTDAFFREGMSDKTVALLMVLDKSS